MKKLLSMMLIVCVFGLTLIGCNNGDKTVDCEKNPDHEDCKVVEKDTLAPILKVAPSEVTIMFEQEYDLMTGVEATDNVDGDIKSSVTIEKGDYDNTVAGQYVIKYKVKDAAGNEATASRTITVQEKMPSIVIDGEEKYAMVYNPILNPKFLMGDDFTAENSLPWHFDLTKVSVFSKDYYDWLYANYPNRLYAGWSNVAVTNAEGEIILLRDHNCNQYTEDGTTAAEDWSNGTLANGYENLHAGLANLNVPEGGHVIVFINDGANAPGSPRTFGDSVVDAGAGIGKVVTFLHQEVVVDHETNQLPVITIPEEDFTKNLIIGDTFDVMEGVTVTDNEDAEVTLDTKIYKLDGDAYVEVDAVTTTDVSTYIIEYSANYDELRKVTARRQVLVTTGETPEEKFISIDGEQIAVVENPLNWTVDGVHIYTKEYWDNNVANFDTNSYQWALVAVVDQYGRIVEVRGAWGGPFLHYTLENPCGVAPDPSVWGNVDTTTWAVDMITNLTVPDGGFVLGFGHASGTNDYRAWAYKNLITDHEFDATDNSADPQQYANLCPINKIFKGEWFESTSMTVDNESIEVAYNPSGTLSEVPGAHMYTKDYFLKMLDVIPENTYQWGLVVVADKNGKVVHVRDSLWQIEWNAGTAGSISADNWTTTTLLNGIEAKIPDGGYLFGFWHAPSESVREFGMYHFVTTHVDNLSGGERDVNPIGKVIKHITIEEDTAKYIEHNGNKIEVKVNPENWASYFSVPGGHLYTKAFWDSIDKTKLNGDIPEAEMYRYSLLVILDTNGNVVEIRDGLSGTHFTADNPTGVKVDPESTTSWQRTTPTLDLVVPDGGYVLAFTQINNSDNTWRTAAYQMFVHTSGDHSGLYNGTETADVTAVGNITVTLPE